MLLKCIEPNEHSTFMAYILDSNSETGTNVLSKIGFMICLSPLIRLTSVANLEFNKKNTVFLHTYVTCSELQPNIRTLDIPIGVKITQPLLLNTHMLV